MFMRTLDESGWMDVGEALARFDDDNMTVANFLKGVVQQTAEAPFQTLMTPAAELNRMGGLMAREAMTTPLGIGLFSPGAQPAGETTNDSVYDYLTGGLTEAQRQQLIAERGMDEARKAWGPVTLTDAIAIGVDKSINRWGDPARYASWALPLAWPYHAGSVFNPQNQVQANGSYLPRSFDMWADDAGLQVWNSDRMTHQLIASMVVGESLLDPSLWFAKPLMAGARGLRVARFVNTQGRVPGTLPDAAAVSAGLDAIQNSAVETRQAQLFAQRVPGRGLWRPMGMLHQMAYNPNVRDMLDRFAAEEDIGTIHNWLTRGRNPMVQDEANAAGLANVISALDTPEDVAALFYTAAYRDKTAADRVLLALERKANSAPLANRIRAESGLGDNALESVLFQFPDDIVPDGHMLTHTAREFVDEHISSLDSMAGLAPDDPASLQARWQALMQTEDFDPLYQDYDRLRGVMQTGRRLFTDEGAAAEPGQLLQGIPKAFKGGAGGARMAHPGVVKVAQALQQFVVPAIRVNGHTSRTSPTVWLLSKPGLTFALHGMDGVIKFDGIIHYVDGILGQSAERGRGRAVRGLVSKEAALPPRGLFADDPIVNDLRTRFIQAAAVTKNPQEARAGIVDELQQYALARIATNRGVSLEAASLLAEQGMQRARNAVSGLESAERGYTTVYIGNGGVEVLAGGPAAVRQTANHVPIMDLKAVDDALKSRGVQALVPGRGRTAVVSADQLLSVAQMRRLIDEADVGVFSKSGERVVARVGRGKGVRALHTVTDLLDEVHTIFKMSVLFRLGYAFRNPAEAHLSAYASGVGWLKVMQHVDIPAIFTNSMTSLGRAPKRWKDRTWDFWGLQANPDAMISAADANRANRIINADEIARHVSVASSPENWAYLIDARKEALADGDMALVARLERDMEQLAAWRIAALHHAGGEAVDAGVITDPQMIDDAHFSTTLFHVDSQGVLGDGIAHGDVSRPLSAMDSEVDANRQVTGWWNPTDWTTGGPPPRGGVARLGLGSIKKAFLRQPGVAYAAKRRSLQGAFDLAHTGRGGKSTWRIRKGQIEFRSGPGAQQFVDDLRAYEQHLTTLRATAQPRSAIPAGSTDLAIEDIDAMLPPLAATILDAEHGVTWLRHQQELRELSRDHLIQYRNHHTSPWVDWTGPVAYPGRTAGAGFQFRTVERAAGQGPPRVHEVDAWGPEVDLTNPDVLDAVRQTEKFRNLTDDATWDRALNGERAAQEYLSNMFAQEGFYRVRFPETPNWMGQHVMIHHDGIGEEAFRRAVRNMVDDVIQTGVQFEPYANSRILAGLSRREMKEANKGLMGGGQLGRSTMPVPDELAMQPHAGLITPASILQEGGFDALLDDLVQDAINLRREGATIEAAYRARMVRDAEKVVLRGAKAKQWAYMSVKYPGQAYRVDDALSGADGGMYKNLTAGTISQAIGYAGAAHRADILNDLSRALMNPEEVHPGEARFWDALNNLSMRQLRDGPGAKTTAGMRLGDIDPVMYQALQHGDRDARLAETIKWAIETSEGQQWVHALGLRNAPTVEEAMARADAAVARRAVPTGPFTREERREVHHRNWRDNLTGPIPVTDVDVADVIRSQFNFAEHFLMRNEAVRRSFLDGSMTPDTLRAAYEANPWPLLPFNGLLSPTTAASRNAMRANSQNEYVMGVVSDKLIKLLSRGMEKLGSGPETRLARHPVFNAIAESDWKQRMAFAESVNDGPLTMEQVFQIRAASQRFALKKMEETLYTLKTRSSVDEFMRFVIPFFPAWKNTVHRWGRFAVDNPAGVAGVARQYQTTIGQLHFYSFETGEEVDPQNADPHSTYTLMPSLAAMPIIGDLLTRGNPVMKNILRNTKVPLRSTDVIFQGDIYNPGVGPLVVVPMQKFFEHLPQLGKTPVGREVQKWFLPMGPQQTGGEWTDAISAWLPSAVKPLFNKALGTEGQRRLHANAAITYVSGGYDKNPDGTTKPADQQAAEIGAAVTRMIGIKALMYLVSPVSAQQVGDHEFYAGVYRSLRSTLPTEEEADEAFLNRYGAQNWLYSRSSTFNLTGGMSTAQTVANQRANEELALVAINEFDDPKLLAFTDNMGANGETQVYDPEDYSPYARNWQLKNAPAGGDQPYRGQKYYQEFVDDAKVALGWHLFDKYAKQIDLALGQAGYTAGTYDFNRERARRLSLVSDITKQAVPEWEAERQQIDTGKTERRAQYFTWLVHDSDWVKSRQDLPVVQAIRTYLRYREITRAEIARRYQADAGNGKSLATEGNQDLSMELTAVRDVLSRDSLAFEDWLNRYFRADNVMLSAEPIPGLQEVF